MYTRAVSRGTLAKVSSSRKHAQHRDPVQAQMQASECSDKLQFVHVHCYRNIVQGFQIELVPSASHWLATSSIYKGYTFQNSKFC